MPSVHTNCPTIKKSEKFDTTLVWHTPSQLVERYETAVSQLASDMFFCSLKCLYTNKVNFVWSLIERLSFSWLWQFIECRFAYQSIQARKDTLILSTLSRCFCMDFLIFYVLSLGFLNQFTYNNAHTDKLKQTACGFIDFLGYQFLWKNMHVHGFSISLFCCSNVYKLKDNLLFVGHLFSWFTCTKGIHEIW